jgi:hypothetical protein
MFCFRLTQFLARRLFYLMATPEASPFARAGNLAEVIYGEPGHGAPPDYDWDKDRRPVAFRNHSSANN